MSPVVKCARVLAEPIRCVRGKHPGGVLGPEHNPLAAGKPFQAPSCAKQSVTGPLWAACCAGPCKPQIRSLLVLFLPLCKMLGRFLSPKGMVLSREWS